MHEFLEVDVNLVFAEVSDIESAIIPKYFCVVLRDGVRLGYTPVLWPLQFHLTSYFQLKLIHEKATTVIAD